jgi:hypothetical protein
MDDGYAKGRTTIYEREHRWFYHLTGNGTDGVPWIEMDELRADTGRVFKMRPGTDRYVVLPDGSLEIHNRDGKLISTLRLIVPPPPAN